MKVGEAVAILSELFPREGVLFGCNGDIGREVYSARGGDGVFPLVGSMGLTSSTALGFALARPETPVAVVEGDGNLLMGFGSLTMVGEVHPRKFYHFLLDNRCYGTTGGQPTLSGSVNFAEAALACGYEATYTVHEAGPLRGLLNMLFRQPGPSFVHIVIDGERGEAPRLPLSPSMSADLFSLWVKGE